MTTREDVKGAALVWALDPNKATEKRVDDLLKALVREAHDRGMRHV